MKKLIVCLLLLTSLISKAQVYNNEWIDYSKTYYKFKVSKTGLHRLPQSILANAGLGNTPAEYFQLWRNGQQVPIYTSLTSGVLPSNGFIEFWGEMNDGKPDNELYKNPDYQLSDKVSKYTDTSAYYLTINTEITSNLHYYSTPNDLINNRLAVEPYFMHNECVYFYDMWNKGYAVNVGSYLYSSVYDKGEGLSSSEIISGSSRVSEMRNLYVYTAGPRAKFKINLSGTRVNPRRYLIKINGDSVLGKQMDFFNYSKDSTTISASLLSTNKAIIEVSNLSSVSGDYMTIHQIDLTYPRLFDFGGKSNFEFNLPASAQGNYLEIKGFVYGNSQPILYDITNHKRYIADVSTPSTVKIALESSSVDRKLVLINMEASNVTNIVQPLIKRDFINYAQVNNQGNYIIITNPLLIPKVGSNPIEEYKQYRSSKEGGNHTAIITLIDEIVDQFAFGIKKHPMSIRNFLLYARHHFKTAPKNVFLIGKPVNYQDAWYQDLISNPNSEKLNLVPTFGVPASDMLLTANKGDSYPQIPIGRLSVVSADEVAVYLKKVKEYEAAQKETSPLIKDKLWMKNVVHAVGTSEPTLQRVLDYYMTEYKKIISDTLFGAKVHTFTKTSPETIQQINSGGLTKLFEDGISLITYFGHSSASSLEFNLNTPEQYNNKGKYPLFIGLGCNAGDYYNFNPARLHAKETLSEKYVLAPDRGTIGFIASSHFGIVHYLDIYNSRNYKSLTNTNYGKSIGENMQYAIAQTFAYTTQDDFYARAQCEETNLHGDPAIILNYQEKPDFAIEQPSVSIAPGFISIADKTFKVGVKIMNIGKAVNKDIVIQVKQEFPDNKTGVVFEKTIPGVRYSDSLTIELPINPLKDKGRNKITVSIDALNDVEELYETNNTVTKEFDIYEDEVRPIYPYNYSIINKQQIKFVGSTANPLTVVRDFQMEIDTTAHFNSPLKKSFVQSSTGGIIEFEPTINLLDNTVYFWRLGQKINGNDVKWNTVSFTYAGNGSGGFRQAHKFQHTNSSGSVNLDSITGIWSFDSTVNNLFIKNTIYTGASTEGSEFTISINNDKPIIGGGCAYNEIIFNVFDPITFKPWQNKIVNGAWLYNSYNCFSPQREYNFNFSLGSADGRKRAMEFIDLIPDGYIVVLRSNSHPAQGGNTYASVWKGDDFGGGSSLYQRLANQGVPNLDVFDRPRAFNFAFKKNDQAHMPSRSVFTDGVGDRIALSLDVKVPDTAGIVLSPQFGPAREWKQLDWKVSSKDAGAADAGRISVIGMKSNGSVDTLFKDFDVATQQTLDVSSIDAKQYPYLQLKLATEDSKYLTPYQLGHWQLTFVPVPEGAVAPNKLLQLKDTFEVGEPANLKLSFKNVRDLNYLESLNVKLTLTDGNNVSYPLAVKKQRPLIAGDSLHINYTIDTRQLVGNNALYIEVNPEKDIAYQPEQYHFNNFIYKEFYVRGDTLNPTMDVTFDNTHILNGDIVAAKPAIRIKLKDNARWLALDNENLVTVKVKFPDQQEREYAYNSDTLRFTAAQKAPSVDNTATIDFKPSFTQDGDYELIVSGKDKSENQAGDLEYRVKFKVINKPMISNMLNYPNPFTTSTAFVFTITGSEVPQNLKIQILTITGKVVKEITKQELGNLHVGRNITDYKWDGTDQYGQKLANGVYLYRVVTNHNGKSLDKYKAEDDKTDQYFNKGYGKMYLMR